MVDAQTTSEGVPAPPTPSELIARAKALVPLLRENAVEAEQLRRLPESTIRGLEDAGMFRMTQPELRGGYDSDPATVSEVMTLIASGCASTAWVMMIYSSVAQLAELLPEAALDEIYSASHPRIAGAFGRTGAVAVPVEGGIRVRGGGWWPFNSGCHHAEWDLLRIMIEDTDGSSTPAFVAIPMADLTLNDDWHVMGASGTGSNSVSCDDIFIPEHRVAPLTGDVRGLIREDSGTNVALPLGMTRYALESFLEVAKSNGIRHLGYERMTDAPVVHAAVTKAAAHIKIMEAYEQWALKSVDPSTGKRDPDDAAILQAGAACCLKLAQDAIETLYGLCPSTEVHTDRPIQRLMRDLHVFDHQHALAPHINDELFGRRMCAS